jgi:hypothetical protein
MFWKRAHVEKLGSSAVPMAAPWGDGLLDLSLSTLWYSSDWNSVSDDELVFLLPSLSRWRPRKPGTTGSGDSGPIDYLTRVLKARTLSAASLISQRSHPSWLNPAQDALDWLVASGIVSKVPISELRLRPKPTDHGLAESELVDDSEASDQLPDWLADELRAIAHLDRLLHDALGLTDTDESARAPVIRRPQSLAAVVKSTVHSRLNGAYVYPEYAFAHELLTVAAVLGHLLQGRAAYISPPIAECITEVLGARDARREDQSVSALRAFADLVGGSDFLVRVATRVRLRGTACLARPRSTSKSTRVSLVSLKPDFLKQLRNEL